MALALTPGTAVYKYQLQNRIGGGGFGEVWLAHDATIGRDVAIKIIESNAAGVIDKLKEAHYGNQLNHQNLVKVHYADVVPVGLSHAVVISMDHHADGSILHRLSPGNFMPLHIAKACIVDVLRGLEYLHGLGLYHGDIKPTNILCGPLGTSVLTDYGITGHSATGAPVVVRYGYILHRSPETLQTHTINHLTDVYQTGMTAFRLFNGLGAIEDRYNALGPAAFEAAVLNGTLVRPTDYEPFIPRQLKAVLNKAIHADPAARYQSAREMRRALEAIHFPGYWTVNSSGSFEGHANGNIYRIEEVSHTSVNHSITCFKKNAISNRETRVTDHCDTGLTTVQLAKAKHDFMQAVIKGEC
jgi:serine/threonine protein kinase